MSGIEILGIAASAVQLAQVTVAVATSLSSLFVQVRDAPKAVESRLLQVQTLVEIARLVACMAEGLRDVLQGLVVEKDGSSCKKWAKAVGGVIMEKKIVGFLQRLEVDKSALTLCITRIDS